MTAEEYFSNYFSFPTPAAQTRWVSEYEAMRVHVSGDKPDKLLRIKRPNEPTELLDYRLDTYKPITQDPILRAITNLQRIFSKGNVDVDIDPTTTDYLAELDVEGHDLMTYIQQVVVKRMIEDPNGVLIWWPKEGEVLPLNERRTPTPILVLSRNIIHISPEIFTFKSGRKLTSGGKEFEWHYTATKEGFYRSYVTAKRVVWEEVYKFREPLTFAPWMVLGGYADTFTEAGTNKEIPYLRSYFFGYRARAEEAICQFSDHQATTVTAAYPIRVMAGKPCTEQGCKDGRVYHDTEEYKGWSKCGTCNGTGQMIPTSPFGVLVRPTKEGLDGGVETAPILEYISPSVDILEYGNKLWKEHLEAASEALHLIFIKEAQSGIAKEIDREDKVAALDVIGRNVFTRLVKKSIECILAIRWSDGSVDVVLPTTFRVRTDEEITADMTDLRTNKAPDFLLRQSTWELIKKRYGSNRYAMKVAEFLFNFDPLFIHSEEQKRAMLAASVISEDESLRSLYAPAFVEQLAMEMGDAFFDLTFDQIKAEVEAKIEQLPERPARVGFGGFGV